jgi:hypothetical protein
MCLGGGTDEKGAGGLGFYEGGCRRASAEESAIGADYIRVSSVARDLACVIEVGGELNLITEREFAVRAAEAVAACRGPVLFDLSGLDFLDCRGARALARAVGAAPSPGLSCTGANRWCVESLTYSALTCRTGPNRSARPRLVHARVPA